MHHFIISLFGDCLVLHYLECNVFLKYIVGGSGNVDNSKNKIGKYNCWKKTIQFWYIFKAFRVLMITCFLKHFFLFIPHFSWPVASLPPGFVFWLLTIWLFLQTSINMLAFFLLQSSSILALIASVQITVIFPQRVFRFVSETGNSRLHRASFRKVSTWKHCSCTTLLNWPVFMVERCVFYCLVVDLLFVL